MTKQTRRKFTADFKAKVALEAIKNQKTLAELSQYFEVNSVTISKWKAEFLKNMSLAFGGETSSSIDPDSPEIEKLYAQIGQLKDNIPLLKTLSPVNRWLAINP